MDLSQLYEFSMSFGPPKVDLRLARIHDDWGDTRCAKLEINHQLPDDVTLEELQYYYPIWLYMDLDSVLFYAYSVFKYKDCPSSKEAVGWGCSFEDFFETIEKNFDEILKKENIGILFSAMKDLQKEDPFFFDNLPRLKKLLRVKPTTQEDADELF